MNRQPSTCSSSELKSALWPWVRDQFPLIRDRDHCRSPDDPLVFLDSAASSQKPQQVIDRISQYYKAEHANIHRGLYSLSEQATQAFEDARQLVASFLGARESSEVIFTRGCTESINLVARSWGTQNLTDPDDELILSVAEHHANIVPWQILQQQMGFKIHYVSLTEEGRFDLSEYKRLLNPRTKLVSVTHVSNVLGWVNPIDKIVQAAHEVGAYVMVDGAQAVGHRRVDVETLGVDFYAFSSHKMCGPTGVGVLWGRRSILETMPPYQGGGDMIVRVSTSGFEAADLPHKFEAGTPHIAGVLGYAQAVSFLTDIHDQADISAHSRTLAQVCMDELKGYSQVRVCHLIEDSQQADEDWQGIISMEHSQIHAHDLACFLDSRGVCVRAGHHCAMPLCDFLGVSSTLRVSPYIYNNLSDIHEFIKALDAAERFFGVR